MSLYHHFADKHELLDAVVNVAFAGLDGDISAAVIGIENPLDVLSAQALAYVRFALLNPGFYRYATLEPHPNESPCTSSYVPVETACNHFVPAVLACMNTGVIAAGDALTIALEIWATAHGIAAALITRPSLIRRDPVEFAERAIRSTVLGHATATSCADHWPANQTSAADASTPSFGPADPRPNPEQ
jgi:AcrR family transcriptional regulator